MGLYKLSLTQEIQKMAQNFQKLKRVAPEELGINRQYCLNLESLDCQEEILTKKLKELENKEDNTDIINDDNEDNDEEFQKKKLVLY